jgi:hypothetical protein
MGDVMDTTAWFGIRTDREFDSASPDAKLLALALDRIAEQFGSIPLVNGA